MRLHETRGTNATMTKRSSYPAELSVTLQQRWMEAGHDPAALPESSALESLIDTAYQASLLREEDDPVQCRVLVASPDDPELKPVKKADELFVIQFEERSEFTAHEVRKMAAALGYYRSVVAVHVDAEQDGLASIWGMIVTGTHWVNHTEATVHGSASLPPRLVIHIRGPGHLVFSSGLKRVVETIGGQILMEGFDPFRSKWLPGYFDPVRAVLLEKVQSSSSQKATVKLCESFARDVTQDLMRRLLRLVRGRGNGGMLIFLNDENDARLDNWLRIRMRFKHADTTNRFQQLMFELMQRALEVGEANGIAEVRWKDFLQMNDASLSKLHESLVEFSHLLADLTGVDGCLVVNRELRLIGFGGEILGDSHVSCIVRATDLEGVEGVTEPADASGTRHRSAYRLISSVQDAIAVVASQDGGVRFVAHRDGRLVYWPYLP
jgi:hypothetical protein